MSVLKLLPARKLLRALSAWANWPATPSVNRSGAAWNRADTSRQVVTERTVPLGRSGSSAPPPPGAKKKRFSAGTQSGLLGEARESVAVWAAESRDLPESLRSSEAAR